MMQTWITSFPIVGLIGLAFAMAIFLSIKRLPAGTELMQGISNQIQIGAMTYLKRQYLTLFFFVSIVAVLLGVFLKWQTSLAFVSGALCSALAGFLGMKAATKANVRTTHAAKEEGQGKALLTAFNGGAVMGVSVASLGPARPGCVVLDLWKAGNRQRHQRFRHGRQFHRPVCPGRRWDLYQSRRRRCGSGR